MVKEAVRDSEVKEGLQQTRTGLGPNTMVQVQRPMTERGLGPNTMVQVQRQTPETKENTVAQTVEEREGAVAKEALNIKTTSKVGSWKLNYD